MSRISRIVPQPWRFIMRFRSVPVICLAALVTLGLGSPRESVAANKDSFAGQAWVTTWGASPEPTSLLGPRAVNPSFANQTLRLIVRTSIGGKQVRVRISNAFGEDSLVIGAAHIALRSDGAKIAPATDRALTFAGVASTTIPP